MAFTGTAVFTMVAEGICRITGLSLLAGAAGTVSLLAGSGQIKLPAEYEAQPYAAFGETVGLDDSIDVTSGPAGTGGGSAGTSSSSFFGQTTGTGSAQNDYASTIAVQTTAGTGRVPFPQTGPTVGGSITRSSSTAFLCNVTGVYKVSWAVGISEISQLQLTVNDVLVANTCNLSNAINQINSNSVLLSLVAGDLVSLVNPAGNGAVLTVTAPTGTATHAQSPTIVFDQVVGSATSPPVLSIAKTGASEAAFLATITNTTGGPTSELELYFKYHS